MRSVIMILICQSKPRVEILILSPNWEALGGKTIVNIHGTRELCITTEAHYYSVLLYSTTVLTRRLSSVPKRVARRLRRDLQVTSFTLGASLSFTANSKDNRCLISPKGVSVYFNNRSTVGSRVGAWFLVRHNAL